MAFLLVISSIVASITGMLLVQSPSVFASEFMMESGVSTSVYQIPYSVSDGCGRYFVNGISMDRTLFCKVLQFFHGYPCISENSGGHDGRHWDNSFSKHPIIWFSF